MDEEQRQELFKQGYVVLPKEALSLWVMFLTGKLDLTGSDMGVDELLMSRDLLEFKDKWNNKEKTNEKR